MRRQARHATENPNGTLSKTCQTCFKAKIRCSRTQDSTSCDRCLRLDKRCVFPPARQKASTRPKGRIIGRPSEGGAETSDDAPGSGTLGSPSRLASSDDLLDPLSPVSSWLDLEREEQLFNVFQTQLSPRFPFVVLSKTVKPRDMRQRRPCTYLAVLAVACSADFVLQRKLSGLFNRTLAAKMTAGELVSLDVLQGLLLHIAW